MSLLVVLHVLSSDDILNIIPLERPHIFKKISKNINNIIKEKKIKFLICINFNANINNMFSITNILKHIININKIYNISEINLKAYFLMVEDVYVLINIIKNNTKLLNLIVL